MLLALMEAVQMRRVTHTAPDNKQGSEVPGSDNSRGKPENTASGYLPDPVLNIFLKGDGGIKAMTLSVTNFCPL